MNYLEYLRGNPTLYTQNTMQETLSSLKKNQAPASYKDNMATKSNVIPIITT